MKLVKLILTLTSIFFYYSVVSQVPGDDKTLSPYFHISGKPGKTESLPLKSIDATVSIAGTIADVQLAQTFVNTGRRPIEAVYVFPASTKAAVYGLEMTIGDRIVRADIEERSKAKKKYAAAKKSGFRASLLEQNRPNVFQMSVANIMPGDTIETVLHFTELLEPIHGKYQYVLPLVVGPRYSTKFAKGASDEDKWVSNPYLSESEAPDYSIDLQLNVSTGVPIQLVRSSTHQVDIQYHNESRCSVSLDPSERYSGNRDFVLEYFLKGKSIETGMLVHEDSSENFFTLMVQPPETLRMESVPSREYVFVVDVSGSMHGYPLDVAKDLMTNLLGTMKEQDRFNIVLFAYGSHKVFDESQPATLENIKKATKAILKSSGGGGTNLYSALENIYRDGSLEDYSRSIVIVTDGYIDAERNVFELIRNNLNTANAFAFGIGTSVNRYLIEGMAKAGEGEPFVLENERVATSRANAFEEYISKPALTNIVVDYGDNHIFDVYPTSIPDVLAERPIIIQGKYSGDLKGPIVLSGSYGEGNYSVIIDVPDSLESNNNGLKYLWARKAITELVDYGIPNKGQKEQVTALGLKYSLLTEYTSFVAVDNQLTGAGNRYVSVKQPLPLPEGVSNYAVGGGYRQSMRMTGATERATAGGIDFVLPKGSKKYDFANPQVALRWKKDLPGPYLVTIKNIFNETLLSVESEDEEEWIDFDELDNPSSMYIVSVSSKADPSITSTEIAFKRIFVEPQELLADLNDVQEAQYYLQMAVYYEQKSLLVDALTTYFMAVLHYPDDEEIVETFEEFLARNGIF